MFIKYKVQFMHDGRTICWEDWDSGWSEHEKICKFPNWIGFIGDALDSDFTKDELEAYDIYGLVTDRIIIWNANASEKDSWHRVKELRVKGKFREMERLQKIIKSTIWDSWRSDCENASYDQKIIERAIMNMIDDAIYDYERGKGASAERRKKDSELVKPITDVSDTVLNELNDMALDTDSNLNSIYSNDFQKMKDLAEKSFKAGEISEKQFLKIRDQVAYASGKISPMREELEKAQKMMQTELDAIREKF